MNYVYAGIGIIVTTIASPVLVLISIQWVRTYSVPPQLPWAGLKNKRLFPKLRASLREVTARRDPINEGYENYSKHGEAFVLPGLNWPDVALPPSNISWLVSQPESILSASKAQEDILSLSYLSHGPNAAARFDFSVIRRDVTRNMSKVLPGIFDEIRLCFEENMGNETEEWKEVKIFELITDTSRRLNNRLFVGLPLCRDKRYIEGLRTWEILFGVISAVIRYLIPYALKPLLAPVVAIPIRIQAWRLKRLLYPMVHQRSVSQRNIVDSKSEEKRPTDILQWLMDSESDRRTSHGMTTSDIAGKTIELNFFSVHTVAINCGSTLTDILCYHSAASLIAELREEAESVIPNLETDRRAVREMVKMDSVIRESLRVNTMGGRGLSREVVAPDGVTTPDGLYLPCGTHVCFIVSSRQRDLDVWERGNEFVPFRFVRPLDQRAEFVDKSKSAVHVTEDFLSFGYGQHACPGRFFAVQVLKLLLGYLLINYDFEPLTERPKCLEIGEAVVPKEMTTVKIRRRQSEPT